jgi:hypothetical protein
LLQARPSFLLSFFWLSFLFFFLLLAALCRFDAALCILCLIGRSTTSNSGLLCQKSCKGVLHATDQLKKQPTSWWLRLRFFLFIHRLLETKIISISIRMLVPYNITILPNQNGTDPPSICIML